jgi:hypothetical protein
VHSLELDGRSLLAGDIYHNDFSAIPVQLGPAGTEHTLLIRVRGRSAASIASCGFQRAAEPVTAFQVHTVCPQLFALD